MICDDLCRKISSANIASQLVDAPEGVEGCGRCGALYNDVCSVGSVVWYFCGVPWTLRNMDTSAVSMWGMRTFLPGISSEFLDS